jgi:multimeric flavodoxin WrbA
MKILALIGSPRKGGNTDTLVDQILKGAKKADIRRKSYMNTKTPTYCRKCKRENVCPINEG